MSYMWKHNSNHNDLDIQSDALWIHKGPAHSLSDLFGGSNDHFDLKKLETNTIVYYISAQTIETNGLCSHPEMFSFVSMDASWILWRNI